MLASRAGALLASGRLDEAARSYEQLTGGEAAAEAFVGLAMCSVHQGEAERAAGMLDRAQELGYPSATARFLRAQILVDLGRVAEADRLAHEAAEERPPSDPEALYTLAHVGATAHLPYGEETLRRYVELQMNDPDLPALLERPAPGGATWRDRISVASRPDV